MRISTEIIEQMRTAFRAEALDLLIELDSALLALETEPGDSALVHRVFRAIHTIKGSGATAGFAHLARFAHKMEEAFDLAREGRLDVTPELIDCGLKACDVIRVIIDEKDEGAAVPGEPEATGAFARLLPAPENPPAERAAESQPEAAFRAAFEIVFKPHRDIFYSGADPVTLLDDLRELGQAHITAHADQVPPLPNLEAEHCYLWWEILLVTSRDRAAIQDVFVFAADECDLEIRLLEDQASAVALLGSVPAEAFELFVQECEEHLEQIERDALVLEDDPTARDNLDALFRGVHSIKGNAGLLLGDVRGAALTAGHPLQLLLRVSHGLESLLDPFRGVTAGPVPDGIIQIALETCDAVRTLLGSLTHNGAGGPVSPDLLARLGLPTCAGPEGRRVDNPVSPDLLARLGLRTGARPEGRRVDKPVSPDLLARLGLPTGAGPGGRRADKPVSPEMQARLGLRTGAGPEGRRVDKPVPPEMQARLGLRTGAGPVSAEPQARLGPPTGAAASGQTGGQPMDGREAAFLNTTSQCIEMIAGCFERLENGGESAAPVLDTYLRGLKTWSAAARYRNCTDLEEPLTQQLRILDAAMKTGALGHPERAALGKAFQAARSVLAGVSPESPASPAPEPGGTAQSAAKTAPERTETAPSPSTIRVDQNKLDRLMRIVGELLVARGAFPLLVRKLNGGADGAAVAKDLKETGSNISRLADELQSSVMSIRMLPVKTVLQRFPRLVRDLARSLGKQVRLLIEGEGIELDKTILEQIGDPLVHVIRNALDHGLETPGERQAQGKDACGQLTLRASHQAGGVVIEVADDGRGLDAGALKRRAVEKGLLTREAAAGMSDEAAFQLVFLPGLSTATKVTDVSGRGVGMDVVRSNVANLHGTVEIRSKPGRGTAFLIKLPASLMVSKGILLEAGAQEYILPLSSIRDMVKLPLGETHQYRGLTLATVRGTVYSLYGLADMLGLAPQKTPELSVAIVEAGTVKYGLVVDKFVSEVEVLVKPLSGGLKQCKEFQGAAIMGDGRVVLVLNALECHSLDRTACSYR